MGVRDGPHERRRKGSQPITVTWLASKPDAAEAPGTQRKRRDLIRGSAPPFSAPLRCPGRRTPDKTWAFLRAFGVLTSAPGSHSWVTRHSQDVVAYHHGRCYLYTSVCLQN